MYALMVCLPLCSALPPAGGGIEAPRVTDKRLAIELFAAEPDIVTPIGITVDAKGRVLVVESHTHLRPGDYDGPATDRIRLLEDSDGDGRADRVSTFFEGTTATMNLAVHPNGWVYVATRQEIFRLRDKDGDGRADERQPLAAMKTATDYPHNGLSGFAFDFSGDVYFSLGENRGADYTLTGADGTVLTGGRGAGCIFRCRPDGSRLTRLATGFWNPFHLCFDTYGRMFAVDNDPGAEGCRLLAVMPSGDYGYRRRALKPFISWNGEIPGTLPMVSSTGEAPTGVLAYESDLLPEDYRGKLLVACWGEHRVDCYDLQPAGASFRATARPLVIGGGHFRPAGIALAPDGSLYVSDWADRSYEVHKKGRIWRLGPADKKASKRPPRQHGLASAHRLLRESAAHRLAADPAEEWKALRSALRDSPDPRVRSVALSALLSAGAMSSELAAVALADPHPAVREQAVRTLPRCWVAFAEVARKDASIAVRAAALRRLTDAASLPLLLDGLGESDPYLRQAAQEGLRRSLDLAELRKLMDSNGSAVRLAVLLLLRELEPKCAEAILPRVLEDPDPHVRFAAVQWVGEQEIKAFRPQLTEGLRARAASPQLLEAYLAALAQLDGVMRKWDYGKEGDWWKKEAGTFDEAARLLVDPQVPPLVRRWALRLLPPDHKALTSARLKEFAAAEDPQLRAEAIRILRVAPQVGEKERSALLRTLAQDAAQPAEVRAEAAIGINANAAEGCAALVALALDGPPPVRQEALRTLRGAKLDDHQRKQLAALAKDSLATAELVARIFSPSIAAKRPKSSDLDSWLKLLEGPADPSAGERIFFHPKGPGCFHCHRIDGRGQRVGPDFVRTAGVQRFTRRQLVESILQPSREVAPAYVPWMIVTTSGKTATGIFHKDMGKTRSFYNAQEELMSFRVSDIEQLISQQTSIMPEGLSDTMTTQEFRDLIAYLMKED